MFISCAEIYQQISDFFYRSSFYPLKSDLKKALQRRAKGIKSSLIRFEKELGESLKWADKEKEGQLLQAHFSALKRGEKSIELLDWETNDPVKIDLDPKLTPHEEVSTRFKSAKKLRKGIPHLQFILIKNRVYLRKIELLGLKIPFAASEEELEAIRVMAGIPQKQGPPSVKKALEKAKPYFEFFSEARIPIWVGKSAKENDLLTFQHANGLDTWLHAADCPGSHVVIKTAKGQKPDPETVKDAVELALQYSKVKDEGVGDVVMTLTKHVKRYGKNQPGKVQVAQEKVMRAKREPERLKRLKAAAKTL